MKTNVKSVNSRRTFEGAVAYQVGAEQELKRSVLCSLLNEQTFYENGELVKDRIKSLMTKVPADKLVNIILEAKNVMHLRHTPLFMAREFARIHNGSQVSDLIFNVIQRADELAEFVSLYWAEGKCPLSKQVKVGLARAFTKFGEYQLAKYNRDEKVKLRDVLFLVHPKAKDIEQQNVWNRLVEGTLATPNTWEVRLSSGEDKKTVFEDLMRHDELGGLAFLRNLRNMIQVGVDSSSIRNYMDRANFSKVLPFRFVSAAKYAPQYEDVLEQAMFKSLAEMPKLKGKTAIIVDNSYSMYGCPVSAKSEIDRSDAACAMAMMVREICDEALVISFSNQAVVVPNRRGFALRDAIKKATAVSGTDTANAVRLANQMGYDRIIIVTDEQSSSNISKPQGKGYILNVNTYQNGIGYGDWVTITGWSEGVVGYIQEYENL